MDKHVFGVGINIPGIEVAIVDIEEKSIVSGFVSENVNCNESLETLIDSWASAIEKCSELNSLEISKIGIGIPGPFDYEKGISLMKGQGKFDALYQVNVKEKLAERLNIAPANITMENIAPCFLHGEVLVGAAKGYKNVLGFTLNYGLGSGRHHDGLTEDGLLWNKSYKDGIAEDYLGIQWISKRYEEFTGVSIVDMKDIAGRAKADDGIGQLVFNEYGENFVKFLMQYVPSYNPDLILIGGHNNAWDLFVPHVKDRLQEKHIKIPIKPAVLGDAAHLIGAADLCIDGKLKLYS
ncbi:ROK family protein [Paradesertivirga mongoliensis]|uniref:ROK family protein n=1 Tax=Paradesertivirga mongoliensis TaxID=2100740 RepID=A0ABW4ZNB6_9SPHI|nr:ROK family protein [Pedobacter mongoliensis]